MFAIVAAVVLSQFSPAELEPVTVEEYLEKCTAQKPEYIKRVRAHLTAKFHFYDRAKRLSRSGSTKDKAASAEIAQHQLKELDEFEADADRVPDPEFLILTARAGQIGFPMERIPDPNKKEPQRTIKAKEEFIDQQEADRIPAAFKVADVLDESFVLVASGPQKCVLKLSPGQTLAKGRELKAEAIYRVIGTYTVGDGDKKTTLPVLEVWEHSKTRLAQKAAAEKAKPQKAKPTKK